MERVIHVSGMCHIMHMHPWKLFHFEEKVKCVFAIRGYSMYCVTCTKHALNALHEFGTWEEGGELGCSHVSYVHHKQNG